MNATRVLRLNCWQGYDHRSVLAPFEARHRCQVDARALISDAQAAADVCNGSSVPDLLNINNAYVAKWLHPRGHIRELDETRFGGAFDGLLPRFERLYHWSRSCSGDARIGICQRFGAFNFVVNTRRISRALAEDEGFALTNDPTLRYGILDYEDFNIFHLCIASGLDPFRRLCQSEEQAFEATARAWWENAQMVTTDHQLLNRALVDGAIDLYLSGGVYTASPARLDGHHEVVAVTPRRGPIGGRGGIVFTEITSVVERDDTSGLAEPFLEYLIEPETARRVALVEGTCNPVAQMGDPSVLAAFTSAELAALQWETLEADISRCADYDLVPNHAGLAMRLTRIKREVVARAGAHLRR